MEHYAKFIKIGGGVWSVVVMERDESEAVHELARDYTDAERGTLDVLADLGWEPIGTEQTPIVSGAGMGYSRPVRRRATPITAAQALAARPAPTVSAPYPRAAAEVLRATANDLGDWLGSSDLMADEISDHGIDVILRWLRERAGQVERCGGTPHLFADLALSASVHDVADLSALLVFIVAADLVELLADFAEVIANDATVRNDRAELVERATSIVAARGYIPPADMIGTVRS